MTALTPDQIRRHNDDVIRMVAKSRGLSVEEIHQRLSNVEWPDLDREEIRAADLDLEVNSATFGDTP